MDDLQPGAMPCARRKRPRLSSSIFFGFRARNDTRLIEVAREHGAAVILDCCHSFGSWSPTRPAVDGVFFSFRKSLPVADGGALLGSPSSAAGVPAPDAAYVRRREAVRRLERLATAVGSPNPYPILDCWRCRKEGPTAEHDTPLAEHQASIPLQHWLTNPCLLGDVVENAVQIIDSWNTGFVKLALHRF